MNESNLEGLTQRFDRLERENRRLKLAGAILLLALAAVGAMGQVFPKAVPRRPWPRRSGSTRSPFPVLSVGDRQPSMPLLQRLARALGVSVTELLE